MSRLEELLECSSAGREQGSLFGARRDGQGFISMARLCGDEEESVGRYVYLKLKFYEKFGVVQQEWGRYDLFSSETARGVHYAWIQSPTPDHKSLCLPSLT